MTEVETIEALIFEVTPEELDLLPLQVDISNGVTLYNVRSDYYANEVISEAANNGWRVQISGHDSASYLMVPIFSNEGHTPGIDAQYFLDEYWTSRNTSLSDVLRANSPIGELGIIDLYQITVYKTNRL